MDDSVRVHVLDRCYELVHEIPRFLWGKFLALFYHLAHRLLLLLRVPYSCRVPE